MKKKYYLFQMNVKLLNVISVVLLVLCFVLLSLIYGDKCPDVIQGGMPLTFVFMIPYFCLHEVFHSIGYVLMGADFKNITYGAHIEKGVLCCLCKQNISKNNILVSLLFPFFWLGVVTLIVGYIFNLYPLVLLSLMNIAGCAGDFIMFFWLSQIKDFEFSEYDSPIAFGLNSKNDLSKKKMFGLDFVEETNKLERTIGKKITISKPSIIYILLFMVLGICYYFIDIFD